MSQNKRIAKAQRNWRKRARASIDLHQSTQARYDRGENLQPRPSLAKDELRCYICVVRQARQVKSTRMRCGRCGKPICDSHSARREGGNEVYCGTKCN